MMLKEREGEVRRYYADYNDIPEANRRELAQNDYNNMDDGLNDDSDTDETEDATQEILNDLLQPYNFDEFFKMPNENRLFELVGCPEFAEAADEFMRVQGEDNIFRSGLKWLVMH